MSLCASVRFGGIGVTSVYRSARSANQDESDQASGAGVQQRKFWLLHDFANHHFAKSWMAKSWGVASPHPCPGTGIRAAAKMRLGLIPQCRFERSRCSPDPRGCREPGCRAAPTKQSDLRMVVEQMTFRAVHFQPHRTLMINHSQCPVILS
jgi:hypothetical protein